MAQSALRLVEADDYGYGIHLSVVNHHIDHLPPLPSLSPLRSKSYLAHPEAYYNIAIRTPHFTFNFVSPDGVEIGIIPAP